MPSVWEQRFANLIAKVTGLRESTRLELLPDLMPVMSVYDPTAIENLFVREEKAVSFGHFMTAIAGNLATMDIRNTTPGMLLCIDSVHIACGTTQGVRLSLETTAGMDATYGAFSAGGAVTHEYLDRRFKNTSEEPSSELGTHATNAGLATELGRFLVVAGQSYPLHGLRCVLVPGTCLAFQGENTGSTLSIAAYGRERFPDQAEFKSSNPW